MTMSAENNRVWAWFRSPATRQMNAYCPPPGAGTTVTLRTARKYSRWVAACAKSKARRVVRELFQLFLAEPQCLPTEWAAPPEASEAERARIVADYLAGMTDRFALDEHRRLFDTYAPV